MIFKKDTALVFDMDGVLVDARESYLKTIKLTYQKYTSKTVTNKEIQAVRNLGGYNNDWDLTMYLLEKEGIYISYEALSEEFQNIYWNEGKGLINNEKMLFDKNLFLSLAKNYYMSIFTGRYNHEANYALNRFKALDIFVPVITTDDVPFGKTKPDPFGLNLIKSKIKAKCYYYFGDTTDDIKAAKSAGYIAVGVLPPQDKSEELILKFKETGADAVLNSINDIQNIL